MKKIQKNRKIVAAILTVVLLFSSMGGSVFAAKTDGQSQAEILTEERNVESTEETVDVNETESEAASQTENTGEQVGNGETQPQDLEAETEPELQVPEVTPEITDVEEEGTAYSPPHIVSFQILASKNNKDDVTTGLSETVEFNTPTGLGGEANTLWIGYRFTLPAKSPSGGEYSFVSGTYSWLQPLDGQGQISVQKKDGNWVLEGKVLAQGANGAPVAPGLFNPSIKVESRELVNGERAELKGECWLIDNPNSSSQATATMTSQGDSVYYVENWTDGEPAISGYFNKSTGDFSLRNPKNPEGYVYGRVYKSRHFIWNNSGTERVDPTKPLTFNFEYKLFKDENGERTEVTDSSKKPVLMAMKRSDGSLKESQLPESPVNDFTLGGLITDTSNYNGPFNADYYRGGDYTFERKTDSEVQVSAVLSKDNKDSGYKQVVTYALIFVPVTEAATAEDKKNPPYKLMTEVKDLQGTSYSSQPIKLDSEKSKGKVTFPVYSMGTEEKLPLAGLMTRSTYIANDISTGKKDSVQETRVTLSVDQTTKKYIRDYNIHSINMLIKFEDGLTFQSIKNYSGTNYSEQPTFLYGIKEDGKPWVNEIEMNHTQDYELRYYDSYEEAERNGKVVAVLVEFRNGVWAAGSTLAVYPMFKLTGESGTSPVYVQDVKVWRGEDAEIESWKGTSGKVVTEKIEPYDFMVPYDNPKNNEGNPKERVYRRDVWPENASKPNSVDGHTYGDTIFIIGGSVKQLPFYDKNYPSKNLNGTNLGTSHGAWSQTWSSSTFDISLGQRVVDRVISFEVKDVGEKELSFKVKLDDVAYNGTIQYLSRIGKVYLSTKDNPVTYVPNKDVAKRGTIKGGIVINPDNFTVPGDGIYQIYYSTYLGSETDLTKDVPSGEQWHQTKLSSIGDTPRYAKMGNTNTAYSTVITKTASTSISKSSVSEGTREKAEYNLMIQEYKQNYENIFIMDILPYNDDDAGSKFHGSYSLEQNKIAAAYQSPKGETKSKMRLFYTTDKNIRTLQEGKRKEADIFRGLVVKDLKNEFKAGDVMWQEATANTNYTSFELPEGVTPTAVVLAGNVEKEERVTAKISLVLEGQKVGDNYNNVSSTQIGTLDSSISSDVANVTVIGRNVAGTAWQDKNKNGIFDEGDVTLEGVKARLYKKDGTEITKDANNKEYKEAITDKDGRYFFEDVPENADGYYIKFEGTDQLSINDYQTVEQYKGGAKTPFEKNNDSDVIFQDALNTTARTEIFQLQSDKDLIIGGMVQKADGINAGFEKALTIQAKKEWKGKADTEKQVTVQLQRRKGSDSQWENINIAQSVLNDANSWETSFEKQLVFYQNENNAVERYQYRVAELDTSGEVVEDGTDIVLNGNTYRVKYDETGENSWKISNSQLKNLTIEKEVNGDFGDRTKKFAIDISAQDSDGKPLDGTFACEESGALKEITFKEGKAQTALAHGEKIIIKELPYDTRIEVTETKVDGYTVKYVINKGEEQDSASLNLTEHSVVKVIDTKTDIPDTGIFNNPKSTGILIFVGIIGIAFAGIVVFRKRKGLR